jgi:hypothetical protein
MPEISKANNSDWMKQVHWPLLLFLLTALNVKLYIKVAAILLFLILYRKQLSRTTLKQQRFAWFYIAMIAITLLNFCLFSGEASINYSLLTFVGIVFWGLCIAAAFINHSIVTTISIQKLHTTVSLFFILNCVVTLFQLLYAIADTGAINPYTYQGMYQKYFINTGDRMAGITFDVSTTNAIISSFGLLYFLYKNKLGLVIACTAALLITTSNITNFLLVVVLLIAFVFNSTRIQKSVIIVCFGMLAVFQGKITPQNNNYFLNKLLSITNSGNTAVSGKKILAEKAPFSEEKTRQSIAQQYIDSVSSVITQQKKVADEKAVHTVALTSARPALPKADIHSAPYQRKKDTTAQQQVLSDFITKENALSIPATTTPGKLISFQQTLLYLKSNPLRLISGAGTGRFSSRLAFKATGLNIAGSYPSRFVYINNNFKKNHLALYLFYFSGDAQEHSLINSPDSVYNQLIAEYGLSGLITFFLFYILFFSKQIRKNNSAGPLLLLLCSVFLTGYWFEQLSIVILFELLMLIDAKEKKHFTENG